MNVVYITKKLKKEEKAEAKKIIQKYSQNVKYAKSINDENLILSIMAKHEIILYHKYQHLTITLTCLRQMDSKSINPFTFQPRNIGLRNIFLLGRTLSLFNATNTECLKNLIECMGGNINATSNPNNAELIISDEKIKSEDFSIPCVRSSWIYCISNSSILTPYEKYLIPSGKENILTQNESPATPKNQTTTEKNNTQNTKSQKSTLQLMSIDSCFDSTQSPKHIHLTKKAQKAKPKKKNNAMGVSISQCTIQNAILMSPPNQKKCMKKEQTTTILNSSSEDEMEISPKRDNYQRSLSQSFYSKENQTANNSPSTILIEKEENLDISNAVKVLTDSCKNAAPLPRNFENPQMEIESLVQFSQIPNNMENSQNTYAISYECEQPSQSQIHEFSQDPLLALLGN